MRLRVAIGGLALVWVASVSNGAVRAEQGKSVQDGVFSSAQAERGSAAYKAACSECHGADLAGDGFAPGLAGADFLGNWTDLSVGDLYERIRVSMPPSGPSGVTPAQKADIVAYILNNNKFPTGEGELEPKTEVLKLIKIELKK